MSSAAAGLCSYDDRILVHHGTLQALGVEAHPSGSGPVRLPSPGPIADGAGFFIVLRFTSVVYLPGSVRAQRTNQLAPSPVHNLGCLYLQNSLPSCFHAVSILFHTFILFFSFIFSKKQTLKSIFTQQLLLIRIFPQEIIHLQMFDCGVLTLRRSCSVRVSAGLMGLSSKNQP